MAKALPKAVLAFMPTGSVCLPVPVAAIAETNMKDQPLERLPIPSPTTLEEANPPLLEPPPVALQISDPLVPTHDEPPTLRPERELNPATIVKTSDPPKPIPPPLERTPAPPEPILAPTGLIVSHDGIDPPPRTLISHMMSTTAETGSFYLRMRELGTWLITLSHQLIRSWTWSMETMFMTTQAAIFQEELMVTDAGRPTGKE